MSVTDGVPRQVCTDCRVTSWLGDNRRLLAIFQDGGATLRIVDTVSNTASPLFAAAAVNRAFPTADDRWVVIGGVNVAWVIPLTPLKPTPTAEKDAALTISLPANDVSAPRIAGWSADGHVLYWLMGLDGFRCLYAQRIDPEHRTVAGPPAIVHHFHDPARLWGSTPMSNAIIDNGFVFDQLARVGSIWLREQTPPGKR